MEDHNELFNFKEINEVLENKYRDNVIKETGDRVSIIDFSSTTHFNGQPLDYGFEDEEQFNFNTELIVIETRQTRIYNAYYINYKQDLVIINTITNKKYRICSGHVTLR